MIVNHNKIGKGYFRQLYLIIEYYSKISYIRVVVSNPSKLFFPIQPSIRFDSNVSTIIHEWNE